MRRLIYSILIAIEDFLDRHNTNWGATFYGKFIKPFTEDGV